ncbi:MAG: hypothetical protein RXR43_14825 [Sulfolobus sp.]
MYSVEYACLICGWYPCHRFAPIVYTSESIYIGNLSLGYVEDSKGYDSIAIWVALGPCSACNDNTGCYFTQAGYKIGFEDDGIPAFSLYAFLCAYKGSSTSVYKVSIPIVSGVYSQDEIKYLDAFLEKLNNNVLAQFVVYFSNGTVWCKKICKCWVYGGNAYSAYSIVEAPLPKLGVYIELPIVEGGMINFEFTYCVNGNQYAGPGTQNCFCTITNIMSLSERTSCNKGTIFLCNGWQRKCGGWDYLYIFAYPCGISTYGL